MNIIFGEDAARAVSERHTVLELDTFYIDDENADSVYCVLEAVPFTDLPKNQELVDLHHDMIDDYRKQRWTACKDKIASLVGSWSGEVDSFYEELLTRLADFEINPPGDDWDYIIHK